MKAGLRIDVDTFRGTRLGVPGLLTALERHGIKATFFFSVGPDNMGRHLWRLFKPAFLWKMLRTSAPSLYGWDILKCGVVGQGPDIGKRCRDEIRRAAEAGHEVGLHAWDHHLWQNMKLDDDATATQQTRLGYDRLTEILGPPPLCSAAPGWRASGKVIKAKSAFPFAYNSDCRGTDCFIPDCGDGVDYAPQVPVTLPTYDEMLGVAGVDDGNYNERLLERFRPEELNVLCIHAEVEGVAKREMFEEFLNLAKKRDVSFDRLDVILRERITQKALRKEPVRVGPLPGREGDLCIQGHASL